MQLVKFCGWLWAACLARILRLTVDAESQDFRAKAIVKRRQYPIEYCLSISQSLAAEKIAAPRRRQMRISGFSAVDRGGVSDDGLRRKSRLVDAARRDRKWDNKRLCADESGTA